MKSAGQSQSTGYFSMFHSRDMDSCNDWMCMHTLSAHLHFICLCSTSSLTFLASFLLSELRVFRLVL
jgi:hypothetical protein